MSVEKKYKDKIIALISALMPDVEIYLFGSRATGDHAEFADIDIAIKGQEKIEWSDMGELKSVLCESNIPYHIDVVDYNGTSKDMRESIDTQGIKWK